MAKKQLNLRLDDPFYRTLKAVAQAERRSVPQMGQLLLEEALRSRGLLPAPSSDPSGTGIVTLAQAGGAFAWLEEEPDLYTGTDGEPV